MSCYEEARRVLYGVKATQDQPPLDISALLYSGLPGNPAFAITVELAGTRATWLGVPGWLQMASKSVDQPGLSARTFRRGARLGCRTGPGSAASRIISVLVCVSRRPSTFPAPISRYHDGAWCPSDSPGFPNISQIAPIPSPGTEPGHVSAEPKAGMEANRTDMSGAAIAQGASV